MEDVGKNIQYCRKHYNMTQRDLAEKINKTESSIKKYESGITSVPLSVLDDMSKVFNIDVKYLLGNETALKLKLLLRETVDENELYMENSIDYPFDKNKEETIKLNNLWLKYFCDRYPYKNNKYNIATEIEEEFGLFDADKQCINKKTLKESLSNLVAYANKNEYLKLTDRQQDILFDSVIDYIKFKLYNFDKE